MFFKEKKIFITNYGQDLFSENIILMAGIIPSPLIFKFTYISHILFTYYGDYTDSCIGIKHKRRCAKYFSEKTVYLKKHLVCKRKRGYIK